MFGPFTSRSSASQHQLHGDSSLQGGAGATGPGGEDQGVSCAAPCPPLVLSVLMLSAGSSGRVLGRLPRAGPAAYFLCSLGISFLACRMVRPKFFLIIQSSLLITPTKASRCPGAPLGLGPPGMGLSRASTVGATRVRDSVFLSSETATDTSVGLPGVGRSRGSCAYQWGCFH